MNRERAKKKIQRKYDEEDPSDFLIRQLEVLKMQPHRMKKLHRQKTKNAIHNQVDDIAKQSERPEVLNIATHSPHEIRRIQTALLPS